MATDNEMRTLIALGAFSSVQGGGGDIPDDLTLNSLTACSVTAGGVTACSVTACSDFTAAGCAHFNGPAYFGNCIDGNTPVKVETIGGELYADGYLVHTVGTRPLCHSTLMRGGRYYYLNTDETTCLNFSAVQVHCNETAEIWLETGFTAPQNFALPCTWNWIGTELPYCLCLHHFYDIAARHVKGVGTMANVAFDTPVGS